MICFSFKIFYFPGFIWIDESFFGISSFKPKIGIRSMVYYTSFLQGMTNKTSYLPGSSKFIYIISLVNPFNDAKICIYVLLKILYS